MHNCAYCKNPLTRWTEWKGGDGRFYCGEFCADAGDNLDTASPHQQSDVPYAEGGLLQ